MMKISGNKTESAGEMITPFAAIKRLCAEIFPLVNELHCPSDKTDLSGLSAVFEIFPVPAGFHPRLLSVLEILRSLLFVRYYGVRQCRDLVYKIITLVRPDEIYAT